MYGSRNARVATLMSIDRVHEMIGVNVMSTTSLTDARGTFVKFHPQETFVNSLDSIAFSSNPTLGTIRGLHFQIEPFAEEKLVTCVQGAIFDVIVDLRPDSKTFCKWTSIELSAANCLQIYLPRGIAHGFQTLVPNSIIHYTLSSPYSPESSITINPLGDLGIDWPLNTSCISDKDKDGISILSASQKYAESLR